MLLIFFQNPKLSAISFAITRYFLYLCAVKLPHFISRKFLWFSLLYSERSQGALFVSNSPKMHTPPSMPCLNRSGWWVSRNSYLPHIGIFPPSGVSQAVSLRCLHPRSSFPLCSIPSLQSHSLGLTDGKYPPHHHLSLIGLSLWICVCTMWQNTYLFQIISFAFILSILFCACKGNGFTPHQPPLHN